jgi:hypothetical protein
MPPALEQEIKDRVWRLCLSGATRNNIAEICGIGAGSVTKIIKEFSKDLDSSEYGAIRDLAVRLKKEDMTFADLASMYRRHNYIEKLGANDEEVEYLISNLLDKTKSIPIEETASMVNQLYELSKSESIPPTEVPEHISQKIKEKQKLEEEIQKSRAILDQENIDIQTINEYKKSKEQLKKYGLSTEAAHKLLSVIQSFSEMGFDPQKIVTNYAHIKSLRQTVRALSKGCRILESRAARYKEVLPMCERVVSMGIRLPLLLTLETAVMKAVELDGVPAGSAPYRVLQEIQDYNKLGGIKKLLYDTTLQLSIMKEILGRQNDAVIALAKLQYYGIKESQILTLCRTIETNGHNMVGDELQETYMSSTF